MNEIRALRPGDRAAFVALRRRGLEEEPLAFLASPDDDLTGDPAAVEGALGGGPDAVVFGAVGDSAGALAGVIGLYRVARAKENHKGIVWGLYVAPEFRRRGIARQLLEAAVAHGRRIGCAQLLLSVSEPASAARRLYEAAGFIRWGIEPGALRHGGDTVDDHHLVLRLA